MNITDKCVVCEKSLKYGDVVILIPCLDKVHKRCHNYLSGARTDTELTMTCPFCGHDIVREDDFVRRKYKRHSNRDRQLIVESAEANKDWQHAADLLSINRTTAESWIKLGTLEPLRKGGNRRKLISPDKTERLVEWLEEDPQVTIKQLQEKALLSMGLCVSVSTISRFLNGLCFNVKKVHHEPANMNNAVNKLKRKMYVEQLHRYMESGKLLKLAILPFLNLNLKKLFYRQAYHMDG